MLAEARSRIRRYTPEEARADPGLTLVDTRCPGDDVIDGAVRIPLSVLPWRTELLTGKRVCVVCEQGYSSSLAAALLVELGIDAGDLIGGYEAW